MNSSDARATNYGLKGAKGLMRKQVEEKLNAREIASMPPSETSKADQKR